MRTQTIQRLMVGGISIVALGVFYFSFATPAEAQTRERLTSTYSNLPTSPDEKISNSCVGAAVMVREDALMDAWMGFSSSTTEALKMRKSSLVDAWNIESTKERTKAIKAAWKSWKTSSKAAHTELRKERKSAWDTFKKTVKSDCRMNLPQEEALEKSKSGTVVL